MKKSKIKITSFLMLVLSISMFCGTERVYADLKNDTIWTKTTDQANGFWKLQFSDNDSIFAASGYNDVIFYETATGKEIIRIPGESDVVFINNGKQFIKTNKEKTKLEIWDIKTFTEIDTIECNGKPGDTHTLSNDGRFLIGTVMIDGYSGFRVWDMITKKIFKTYLLQPEPNLLKELSEISIPLISCNNNEIWLIELKVYQDPDHPGSSKFYHSKSNILIYDFETLNTIDTLDYKAHIVFSKNCKYYAVKKSNVEVFDFNTKQLHHSFDLNGPSLTGMKFSSDEKYLVTSSDNSGDGMKIWDLENGKEVYFYTAGASDCIALSNNKSFVLQSIGWYILLNKAKYQNTSINEPSNNGYTLYPNPTTGNYTLQFEQLVTEETRIQITDLNGVLIKPIYNGILEQGNKTYEINTNGLSNGTYYVQILSSHQNKLLKLIILK